MRFAGKKKKFEFAPLCAIVTNVICDVLPSFVALRSIGHQLFSRSCVIRFGCVHYTYTSFAVSIYSANLCAITLDLYSTPSEESR